MRIHPAVIRDTFIHFLFSVLLFVLIGIYDISHPDDLAYFFGYFGCLTFWAFVISPFVSDEVKTQMLTRKYIGTTVIIIVLNMFVPLLGGRCAELIVNFFFK